MARTPYIEIKPGIAVPDSDLTGRENRDGGSQVRDKKGLFRLVHV